MMKLCLVLTAFSAVTVQAQWESLGDKLADGLKFDFPDLFGGKDGVKDVQKGKEKKEKPPKVECPAGWIPVPKSPWDTFIGRERCFQCVGGSEVNRTAAVDACTALGGGTPNSQFLLTIDSFEINQLAATTCQEMGLFSMRGKQVWMSGFRTEFGTPPPNDFEGSDGRIMMMRDKFAWDDGTPFFGSFLGGFENFGISTQEVPNKEFSQPNGVLGEDQDFLILTYFPSNSDFTIPFNWHDNALDDVSDIEGYLCQINIVDGKNPLIH